MKKATILFEKEDAEATARYIRHLGVLHIEHQDLPEGSDLTTLQENVALIDTSLEVILRVIGEERDLPPQERIVGDWSAHAHRIVDLGKRQEELETESQDILNQISEWGPWGDIDLDQVQDLSRHGIYLGLYEIPAKETGSFPDDVIVKTAYVTRDAVHCIAISRRKFECPYREIAPPRERVSVLKKRYEEIDQSIQQVRGEIESLARSYRFLAETRRQLEKEIEFRRVLHGMGKGGPIQYLTGFIPFDIEERLVSEAKKKRWGIVISDPSPEDEVPTLMRNPRWVAMIQPVLEFLGLTPGYRELDVSIPFLIFLCIFFGILIGDAGYGLLYILLTFLLQKKMGSNPEIRSVISLFYVLSSCAVVWGVLSCTFFGQEWLLSLGFRPLVPQLNDAGFMQTFCFFIGALHMSIAHAWRGYVKLPSLTALVDAGYIFILWTAFLLARTLILDEPFPTFGLYLVIAGVILVIVFTNPHAPVLIAIGEGLGTIAMSFVNNITDVISYIRLYAVGLAGLAIAETTNTLGHGFGDGILALAVGGAILIIGHCLNILLGPLSVLVHGIRLNVLEFSGHANVSWSGVAFKPFKE